MKRGEDGCCRVCVRTTKECRFRLEDSLCAEEPCAFWNCHISTCETMFERKKEKS